MTTQCCVCGKIRQEGQWAVPAPDSLDKGDITHGYCPECAAQAMAEVQRYLSGETELPKDKRSARVA